MRRGEERGCYAQHDDGRSANDPADPVADRASVSTPAARDAAATGRALALDVRRDGGAGAPSGERAATRGRQAGRSYRHLRLEYAAPPRVLLRHPLYGRGAAHA